MNTTTEQNVRRAFSKSAASYEMYSGLQKEIGLRLLNKIDNKSEHRNILDIGMGTGWLNLRIKDRFPSANVFGLDFAPGMIDYAKDKNGLLNIVLADARILPFKNATFDLALSNVAYQWVKDLRKAFNSIYDVLKDDGVFYLTCFGARTLDELFISLEGSKEDKEKTFVLDRKTKATEKEVLESFAVNHFKDIDVFCEIVKVHFDDIFALIKWLKKTGANDPGQNIFVGRSWLKRADDFYKGNYRDNGQIYASFEIIWATARK